jgi:hypothetical protein
VQETQELYGEKNIKINIHQLLHIIDRDVENWGLLWTHNAFVYESMNGFFTRFVHGTQLIPKSAIDSFSSMQQLPLLEKDIEFSSEQVEATFIKLRGDELK